jgi:hypothetical protein
MRIFSNLYDAVSVLRRLVNCSRSALSPRHSHTPTERRGYNKIMKIQVKIQGWNISLAMRGGLGKLWRNRAPI